jgi:hypothetical protein
LTSAVSPLALQTSALFQPKAQLDSQSHFYEISYHHYNCHVIRHHRVRGRQAGTI